MKNNDTIVSIVVPVYNCDKYLKKCIDSILNQDYRFLEILLIDDESTDESGSICDFFKEADERVRVLHKKNEGVSKARNAGIELATGKYICFFDSDDYVDANFISYALNKMENDHLDLFNAGFYSEVQNNEKVSQDRIFANDKLYLTKDELKKDLVYLWDEHMLYNVWNKMYSLKIIKEHNIHFPNSNFGEDMEFNMNYLEFVEKFYNSSKSFYHYIKERKGSITSKYKSNLFDIRKEEYIKFNSYFANLGINNYEEFSARRFIERVLGCIENVCSCDLDKKEKKKILKSMLNDEITKETLKLAKPNSKKVKIMLIPLKLNSVFLTFIMGSLISKIRKCFPEVFNKMKNKR